MIQKYDILIIGSGIIGMALARNLKLKNPNQSILIIDKESGEAHHASSRNSGVLHAGFYYTADSLKARFTVAGNAAHKEFCRARNLPLNECGKLVVAQNQDELDMLSELKKRGDRNGSTVSLISAEEAAEIEPNVKTFKKALYSPHTASVDPKRVCDALKTELEEQGVEFKFNTAYRGRKDQTIETTQGEFSATRIINCAGLYADKIAADFGFGKDYCIIPFKGLYLKYTKNKTDVRTNIYPVPKIDHPFLGVHFTKTVDQSIKIGPTAIPAFWRENYDMKTGFQLNEFCQIAFEESRLFFSNAFGFRDLARDEMKKYNKDYFIQLAVNMVQSIDPAGFTEFTPPGIRAQLLHRKKRQLIQDFVVEGDGQSTHILNAVSPAFTCAFPFTEYVIQNHMS